jgi:hypothetical protein
VSPVQKSINFGRHVKAVIKRAAKIDRMLGRLKNWALDSFCDKGKNQFQEFRDATPTRDHSSAAVHTISFLVVMMDIYADTSSLIFFSFCCFVSVGLVRLFFG